MPKPGEPERFSAEPFIFTSDLPASLAFYTGKLGFDLVTTYGAPPFFAIVERGGAKLALRHVDAPVIDTHRRDAEELLSTAITIPDADALLAEFRHAGVSSHRDIQTEPWGARTFIVKDPDGNLILFAS